MKFYNPFKPHIIEDGLGVFRIRKCAMFGWKHLSECFNWSYFWAKDCYSLETAKDFLSCYYTNLEESKTRQEKLKKIVIHHER